MVGTPWGNIEELGTRDKRERLYAAMVAATAEKGYAATTVADLLRLSGISRSTFYSQFKDKEDCFQAAIERLLGDALTMIRNRYELDLTWEEKARVALEAFVWLASVQPAAARMCLVESYAAGDAGLVPLQRAVDELSRLAGLAFDQMPGREGMPADLARAIGGGFHRVLYRRLLQHREEELPGLVGPLWEWAMNYPAPPQPLRLRGRRPAAANGAAAFATGDAEQRIVRAFTAVVAEKGYASTTIADIAAAASISQSTFYGYFDNKEEALAAALDSSGAHLAAATIPAVRRAKDWPGAVRIAYGATCAFLAAEPDFARLRAVEVYAVGPEAIEQRDTAATEIMEAMISRVDPDGREVDPLVAEATQGAIHSVIEEKVRNEGPEALPEVAPLLTYVTLAPFLGAEEACEVANSDGRRR